MQEVFSVTVVPSMSVIDIAKEKRVLAEYALRYIRRRKTDGATWQRIGDELGVTHSWVHQMAHSHATNRIGLELVLALADLLHQGSIDTLRRYAEEGREPPRTEDEITTTLRRRLDTAEDAAARSKEFNAALSDGEERKPARRVAKRGVKKPT